MTPAVRLTGICKRFDAVQALDTVDLTVAPGAIHAIVGENGAGKSTLMKVLYGAYPPDAGQIEVAGQTRHFRSSADAISAGVGMVSQHYSIIGELTCLENLMLGAEPGFVISKRAAQERAETLAAQMGFRFDWSQPAEGISPAAAQKLEILKLLWREARIMILDEPTAMLSPADAEVVFAGLKDLAGNGATVLVVTHRIPEVMAYADHVTVLRGGLRVADMPVAETSERELAEWIVGQPLEIHAPRAGVGRPTARPVLEAEGLVALGDRGHRALDGLDLVVREGEVVGIAGVDGNGQSELFEVLLGLRPLRAGAVRLDGARLEGRSVRERLEAGITIIPEDRHAEGVIEAWSLMDNGLLGHQRAPNYRRGPWIWREAVHDLARSIAVRFDTKHGGLTHAMASLSGGNQQRFVAARALVGAPRLILAFQPARGLDILGAQRVYAALREACARGAAAVVVSFDLDELLSECDRLVVMFDGRLRTPRPEDAQDRAVIGQLMAGAEA